MSMTARVRSLARALLRRDRFEDGMADEMAFHVDAYVADLLRAGVPRDEAQRRARAEFGGLDGLKEECRDARGLRLMNEVGQDVRYSLRGLRRGRSVAVMLVLAIGVGANLAVFSVVHAALLRPLPHPDPDRLVAIVGRDTRTGARQTVSPQDFFDLERKARSFDRVAAYFPPGFTLTGGGDPERVTGSRASSGIFDVFGVRPVVGRGFLPEEDRPGAPRVAVISHRIWTERYGASPAAVGQTILLSATPHTIVGVLPAGFHSPALWPRTPEVWVPIGLERNIASRRGRFLQAVGRLAPGATVESARAELTTIAGALSAAYPDTNAGVGLDVLSLHGQLTQRVRGPLLILTGAVVLLLLVACGNAAGLLIGRTLERRHEFATRLALGASRFRVGRQILAENLLAGLGAGIAGFALARLASAFLVETAAAAGVPRAAEISVGSAALALGMALSLVCAAVAALVAAIDVTRARLVESVGHGTRTPATARPRQRSRSALIAAEAACSLALLAGAGLMLQSFAELRSVQPGIDTSRVVTTRVMPPGGKYPAGPALASFYDGFLDQVRRLPDVESAALVEWIPLGGGGTTAGFTIDDDASRRGGGAELRVVRGDYFRTLRIPLVAGREFDDRDRDGATGVVVINQDVARRYFAGSDPVGRRITIGAEQPVHVEIVGVVGDVRQHTLRDAPAPEIFAPGAQSAWLRHETGYLLVRARRTPDTLAAAIPALARRLEPDAPVDPVQPMADLVANTFVRERLYAVALAAFAAIAVLLAAFGISGAVASALAARTAEVGVRLALGAPRAQVLWQMAGYGALPTLAGVAAGVPMALAAGYLLRNQLFGVSPADAPTVMAVATTMTAVALGASLVPAVRATRIDPVIVLRGDGG